MQGSQRPADSLTATAARIDAESNVVERRSARGRPAPAGPSGPDGGGACSDCQTEAVSAEPIGSLAVGATLLAGLGGLILMPGSWLRADIREPERGQARLLGLIEGSGLFRPPESREAASD